MAKRQLPNYSIDRIREEGRRDHLFRPHPHSFYHLVYFAKGEGRHSIDFVSFPVVQGQIYFRSPGQVHHWEFPDEADGYIINFSGRIFQLLLASSQYLEQFYFFGRQGKEQVVCLPGGAQREVTRLFEEILVEFRGKKAYATDMVLTLLLQIFIIVNRLMDTGSPASSGTGMRI